MKCDKVFTVALIFCSVTVYLTFLNSKKPRSDSLVTCISVFNILLLFVNNFLFFPPNFFLSNVFICLFCHSSFAVPWNFYQTWINVYLLHNDYLLEHLAELCFILLFTQRYQNNNLNKLQIKYIFKLLIELYIVVQSILYCI